MSSDGAPAKTESGTKQSERSIAPAAARIGVLLVVSAPSGAGKSSLIKELMSRVEGIRFSVSYTTRPPRGAETEGVDYHFVSEADFIARRDRGEFLEWARVHDHLYGTHLESVQDVLRGGEDIILDADIQGADQIRHKAPSAVTVFVLPPSFGELAARLNGRNLDSPADVKSRLHNATLEVQNFNRFDYVIVNDELEQGTRALEAVLIAERHRSSRVAAIAENIIDTFGRGLPNG